MRLKLQKILWWLLIVFLPTQTAKHFWPQFSLISGLKIDYLSPTLYLTDLIVLVLLAVDPPHLPSWGKKTGVFVLLILLNIIFSLSPLLTVYKYLRILLYLLLSLRLIQSWSIVKKVFPFSLSVAVIWTCFLAVCQFLTQGSLGGIWRYLGERPLSLSAFNVAKTPLGNLGLFLRAYATFPHPNALAGFLVISFWLLLYLRSTNLKYLSLLFSVIALFLTFSRSAIFIFLLSLGFVFFFKKKISLKLLFVFLVLFVLVFCYLFNFGTPASFSERIYLLQKSFLVIISHPIFGVGLGNFSLARYSVSYSNPFLFYQPVHNIFALLLAETGIPLFLFFCFICLSFIKNLFPNTDIYLKIALIDILLLSLVDHYWLTSAQNLLLLTLLISLILSGSHSYVL